MCAILFMQIKWKHTLYHMALFLLVLPTVTLFPDEMALPLAACYHKRDIDGWGELICCSEHEVKETCYV